MAQIALSRGYFATVDAADVPLLAPYTWWCDKARRAYTSHLVAKGVRKTLMMHRLILNAPAGVEVDHKNRDPLDNRRENLRLATSSQQKANRVPRLGRTGYRGLYDYAEGTKHREGWAHFQARLRKEGVTYRKPLRHTAEEAARDYDDLACEHHGEFAILNFPEIAERTES